MPYTYNKLRGKIIEVFGTFGAFAERIGTSKNSVSRKLKGKIGFSQKDIVLWSSELSIPEEQYSDYFFT